MTIEKLLCALVLVLSSTHVMPQTTFSFAGLSWGDQVQSVDSKLRTAGFAGCGLKERMLCSQVATCSCEFTGGEINRGWARLANNRLESVFIWVHDGYETEDALKKRYGQPVVSYGKHPGGNLSLPPRLLHWSASTGDTLFLEPGANTVVYRSGSDVAKDRAKKPVF